MLGAVATVAGTLLSQADGRDLERALAALVSGGEGEATAAVSGAPAVPESPRHEQVSPAPSAPVVAPSTTPVALRLPHLLHLPFYDSPALAVPYMPTVAPPAPPRWPRGVSCAALSLSEAPTTRSPDCDLALAARGARVVATSPGWSGGRPEDLLDGVRHHDEPAREVASPGGAERGAGGAGGEDFVEVALSLPARLDRVVAWHRGATHRIAHTRARVEARVGGVWRTVVSGRGVASLADAPDGWWRDASSPVEHRFEPVVADRVRYVLAAGDVEPGPLEEIEVYGEAVVEGPSRAEIMAEMRRITPTVTRCVRAPGLATVSLRIEGSSGRVTRATVSGEHAGTSAGSCIARVVRSARFARFARESLEVSYPFWLVPAE